MEDFDDFDGSDGIRRESEMVDRSTLFQFRNPGNSYDLR